MARTLIATALAVLAALASAGPASAWKSRPCAGQPGFRCGTVEVPLDRSGRVAGTLRLQIAAATPRPTDEGVLLALAGGPGQGSVKYAQSFALSLEPALEKRRLVVLDQRGTGGSGLLLCPALQRLGSLAPIPMTTVETCANQIGARRTAYATADSVLDLDAIREALYAPRMALMGISYGTFVATQYARRFPDKVDWMVLDSVVGARGIDPYLLDSFTRVPRIVREQCARDRCRGATRDAYADLEQLVARVRRGPVRGWRWDERGRRVPTAVRDEGELFLMVLGADLNPYLQAALPGAIRAALAGDTELLARLRRLSDGGPTPVADLSAGLNVATICGDVPLPYTFTDPVGTRWDRWQHAIDAVPDAAFTPFSRKTVLDVSLAHDCLRWPEGDVFAAPSEAPLPDVPALLYSGRLDFRTPLENARAVQATLPRAELVGVAGTGHDVLDSDITGCAATALRRFARRRPVGTPCAGRTNIVEPFPTPPRRLRDFRPAPGVRGDRGRIVFGVLDTVVDARVTALQTLYAGFDPVRGGGLRGGTFSASIDEGRFDLRRYQYLDGLRVTGRLLAEGENDVRGRVRVDGPGRLDGWLRLDRRGGVRGRIGGRAVRYRPGASASAAAAGAHPRLAGRPLPSLRTAAARLARRLP